MFVSSLRWLLPHRVDSFSEAWAAFSFGIARRFLPSDVFSSIVQGCSSFGDPNLSGLPFGLSKQCVFCALLYNLWTVSKVIVLALDVPI